VGGGEEKVERVKRIAREDGGKGKREKGKKKKKKKKNERKEKKKRKEEEKSCAPFLSGPEATGDFGIRIWALHTLSGFDCPNIAVDLQSFVFFSRLGTCWPE